MSHKDVYAAVTSVGIKCRHMDWGDEKPPKLPWAIYLGEESPISGSDHMLAVRHDWTVELYEERRNAELEAKLGAAIEEAFGPYTKREVWVKSEGMLMVTYDFHEIEGVNNG